MLKLNKNFMENKNEFLSKGIKLPCYKLDEVKKNTIRKPTWIHFGGGNIFRCFHASIQQNLINKGLSNTGIIVVNTSSDETIKKIYHANDNLTLMCVTKANGEIDKEIIGSVVESHYYSNSNSSSTKRVKNVFANQSLQMVSITITEKGYSLKKPNGQYSNIVKNDIDNGPEYAKHTISILTALLYERYNKGAYPIALLSTDNFSHNGDKLKSTILEIAKLWKTNGFVNEGFINYLQNDRIVSFPLSVIDRITPRPSENVLNKLIELGFESMDIIQTKGHSVYAPFVNTEDAHYLVVEDNFPNGRPPFEEAGVYLTNKQTVDKVEKMKVCTCLNPLHTAMAVYGCLLGYSTIADEMNDPQIRELIKKVGYKEGLPVVEDPEIIDPHQFIDEVINKRLPNKNIPDTPQRIASDTSQKLAIRYGETIKLYKDKAKNLSYIPLVIAGWIRYLMGLNDEGKKMELSPDPMLDELQSSISGIKFGAPESVANNLYDILSNESIFGIDLYKVGLGSKVEEYVKELIIGPGSIRATLKKYLA
ncbi:mannitol dehydrogenase family protein [Lentibacillus sp. L22]|uniref:mannitol dehydrogenase family protein n=1 Tax=Lentibacillus TaxID=175304 RepID=UPI0022B1A999|nr:mannitol dehydrogenase family protein [Lentibacillus daqui]